MVGETLGHYKILALLGKGGMGEVFAARDLRLDREVALKVLPDEMAADGERLDRFEREAKAVAALNHPNIVTLHSVEQAEGKHFLTMELVRGTTLSEASPPHGMPLDKLLALALPLADAVAAAHEQGIIHRDLKPGNVMVGEDGRLKVLDFGLAKLRQKPVDAGQATQLPTVSITEEGKVLGTVSYMSPEQVEGKPADHRSDIFSLGVVLHEMATGQRPFRGDSSASVVSSILRDTPVFVSELNPSLPRQLARIVRHCLQKDPERRCQTAKELRNELAELKQEVDSGDATPEIGRRSAERKGQRRLAIAALATVAVVAAAFGGLWIRERGRSPGVSAAPFNPTFTRLTSWPGVEITPSLSPDGRTFVFASGADGDSDIYLMRVGGDKAINLTEDCPEDDSHPVYSPDGESIAFGCTRDGGGIFVMGATGESKRRLTDFGSNPVWSPDGSMVLFATIGVTYPAARGINSELWVVEVTGGEERRVYEGDAVQPHWSPDGRRIAYWGVIAGQRDIWTIPASGGTAVPVTDDAAVDWNPVWSHDGKYLYFSSDRGGSMNLWKARVDTQTGKVRGEPEPVTTGASAERQHVTLSVDGRRIAYVESFATSNIYKIALDPASETATGDAEAVTRGTMRYSDPHVSPDGEWIVFTSDGAQEDIFIGRADGSGIRRLTNDIDKDRRPRWSPDGTTIAFYSNRGGSYEIWLVHPDGSGLRPLTDMPEHSLVYPVWSPDGSRLASLCSSEHGEIFITDVSGSTETLPEPPLRGSGAQFSVNSWSPDGRWLAGEETQSDFSASGVLVYSLEQRQYERLTDFGGRPVWLHDSRRLVFFDDGKLYLYDLVSRRHEEIESIGQTELGFFGISPDDRWVYFTRYTNESDIWMMDLD